VTVRVIDVALVRELLAVQHPDLANLPVRMAAEGWDNLVFRLGDDLSVRLPRRIEGAVLIEHEQRWVPELVTAGLPLPTSCALRTGAAGCGYPWSWSIGPWLLGAMAAVTPLVDLADATRTLGGFVAALHRPAPPDAPSNPYRGMPLAERQSIFDRGLAALAPVDPRTRDVVDISALRAAWDRLTVAPPWDRPPVWLHGDLHPGNLLVHEGRLSAVIDFGDITSGDPATDLASAWMLLPAEHHAAFRSAAGGIDDATWQRAAAWAVAFSVAILTGTGPSEHLRPVAHRTLRSVLAAA
jgi:aminoglycoside phosphotransferase (APT) family kinase protein